MTVNSHNADRIRPCPEHPTYWQYCGRPVLLLGGSVEDNLFQIPDLTGQLDLLRSVGGNYVRCTMSSRDEGNVWAFAQDPADGRYDLRRPNPEYWRRFSEFLEQTARREIVVQIEIWATFDYYRDFWDANPFNPKNNRTYTAGETHLPEAVATHPIHAENPFFRTTAARGGPEKLLRCQQAFVDAILSHSLRYDHVLYCMDNETSVTGAWGAYWSRYVQAKADEAGVGVETTEMWDPHDLGHPMHRNTFDHPEIYSFVEVSQNNHQAGQAHWDHLMEARRGLADAGRLRPVNNVKVYGADGGPFGGSRDAQERFWRNLFAGCASARFHRPPSGLGLSPPAQAHLRSARMLTDALGVFDCRAANDLLGRREDNEAYCLAGPDRACAVFLPDGGDVDLDASAFPVGRTLRLRWLDIAAGRWVEPAQDVPADAAVPLRPPGRGFWAGLLTAAP